MEVRLRTVAFWLNLSRRLGRLNDEKFQEVLESFPGVLEDEMGEFYRSFPNYLLCKVAYRGSEIEYNEAGSLIETDKHMIDEGKKTALDGLKQNYDLSRSAIFQLAVYPKELICPEGKEDETFVNKLKEEISQKVQISKENESVIENYCRQINKYIKGPMVLSEEIYDFKDWSSDSRERTFQYLWKTIFAFRYGGPERAEKLCFGLPEAEASKNCSVFYNDSVYRPFLSARCPLRDVQKQKEDLINTLCRIKENSWQRFLERSAPCPAE